MWCAGPERAGRCPPPSSRMLCCTSPSNSPRTPGTRVARWVPDYSTAAVGVTAQAGDLRLCLIVKLFIGCRARKKVVERGFGYFGRQVNHSNRRARRLPPSFTQTRYRSCLHLAGKFGRQSEGFLATHAWKVWTILFSKRIVFVLEKYSYLGLLRRGTILQVWKSKFCFWFCAEIDLQVG